MTIKLFEMFAGYGGASFALKKNNIEHKTIGYSDIKEHAIELYELNHPNVKNFGDCTKINPNELEDFDLLTGGFPCFVAGTKIITNQGYKNIEDVVVGDLVLTHKNRFKKVVKIGNQFSKTINLKIQGIKETTTTYEHPYYVRTMTRKNEKRNFSEPYWKDAGKIEKGDFIGIPILQTSNNQYNLTKSDCWMLGRYVADGHIKLYKRKERINCYAYGVVFSIGIGKENEFLNKIGRHVTFHQHGKSLHRGILNSKKWVEFIVDNKFGRSALEKRIPQFILDLPVDLLEEFLNGYMAGDGCFTENQFKASSISEELVMGLNLAIAKIYKVNSSFNYNKRKSTTIIEGRIVNQHDSFSTTFNKEIKKQSKSIVIDDIVWVRFKERIENNVNERVYNLEVEEDNSYTANNAIVHNCQDVSLAGKNDLSKGRTILFDEIIRIAEVKKPRFMLLENVKGLLSKRHKQFYQHTLDELNRIGYYFKIEVLNSKDYGIPHNRERVWYVCFKNKEDYESYQTPTKEELSKSVVDLLELNIQTNVFKHTNRIDYSKIPTNLNKTNKIVKISLPNNVGKIHQQDQLIFDNGILPCLVGTVMGITKSCKLIYPQLRFLTPKECFRFMGFSNDEINLGNLKTNKLYDLAGNGWDINVAGRILVNMLKNYQ